MALRAVAFSSLTLSAARASFSSWTACRPSTPATASLELLSSPSARLSALAALDCMPATVPGTALASLLQNGTFSPVVDPFVDTQLLSLPDIAASPSLYTFIWSTTWTPDAPLTPPNAYAWLTLSQVNYRATVYLDGALLPPRFAPTEGGNGTVGMFTRFYFDLTAAARAGGQHALAVQVEPPDHPGNVSSSCKGCGQGGNHDIAQDVTSQYTCGWDWVAGTPDRNTGLIDAVQVDVTGVVRVRDPLVVTTLTSPVDTSTGRANVSLAFTVAAVALGVTGGDAIFQFVVPGLSLAVNVSANIVPGASWMDVTSPAVEVADVLLWWPATMGTPTLFNASVSAITAAGTVSHTVTWRVGVRTVSSEVDPGLGGRVFRVNGLPVFLQGGDWIAPDQLNRFYAVPQRWRAEVLLHAAAGLNIIRLWGGAGGAPAALYDAADEIGVFLMHEYWMSGDNNGRWAGNYSWPLLHDVYLYAAADTAYLLRGHAALLLWCGGNELYPASLSPPPDIAAGLQQLTASVDASSRTYIPSTMSNFTDFDASFALAPQDGPYGILDERVFSTRNPGMTNVNGMRLTNASVPFQPEIGSTTCPEYMSLARFLSPVHLEALPPANCTSGAGVDDAWMFHKWLPFTESGPGAGNAGWDHIHAYGTPVNASEYALRAALVQYRQYQALFEGFQASMWVWYSAVIMWKTQTPWPSLRGSLYDWYLAPNGGLWGARAATSAGAPLHVQLNQLTGVVTLVNKGISDATSLHVSVQAYDIASAVAYYPAPLNSSVGILRASSIMELPLVVTWPSNAPAGSVLLFRAQLLDAANGMRFLSRSDYWLSNLSPNFTDGQDYRALASLRAASPLDVSATASASGDADVAAVSILFTAPASLPAIAFGVRVTLRDAAHACTAATGVVDDRVLPVLQSDNYFSLIPGETRNVTIRVDAALRGASLCDGIGALRSLGLPIRATSFNVTIDGWNVATQTLLVQLP